MHVIETCKLVPYSQDPPQSAASSSLILAMALAGLSPLGQVRAPVVIQAASKNIAHQGFMKAQRTVEDGMATVQAKLILQLLFPLRAI